MRTIQRESRRHMTHQLREKLQRNWLRLAETAEDREIINDYLDRKIGEDWRKQLNMELKTNNYANQPVYSMIKGSTPEVCIQRALGIEPKIEVYSDSSDGGIDFSYKQHSYDVKTVTGRTASSPVIMDPYLKLGPYCRKYTDIDKEFRADRMILAGMPRRGRIFVYGWTDQEHFKQTCVIRNFTHGDRIVMHWSDLKPMREIDMNWYEVFIRPADRFTWGYNTHVDKVFQSQSDALDYIKSLKGDNEYQIVCDKQIVDEGTA